jgi:NTE family protein
MAPKTIMGHVCVDGAVIENLPIRAAMAVGKGPIVAVDVGGSGGQRHAIERQGFAATYTRGLEIVMQTLAEELLQGWTGPPVILVRPRVERISMFAFNRTPYLIAEGFRSLNATFDQLPEDLSTLPTGIHPQREIELKIDAKACVGCGFCFAREPDVFGRGEDGKAVVRRPHQRWSPLGDRVVRGCPTGAISADETPVSDNARSDLV